MRQTLLIFLVIFIKNNVAQDYCESKLCILDAERLINSATDNEQVKPCDDFKEFSVGKFYRYKALHDRYERIGFLFDAVTANYERQRKMLIEPIKDNESFVSKIAKNFFQKCIDPDYILNQGKQEAIDYLKNKNLQLVEGNDWQPQLWNLSARVYDPSINLDFFLTHKITRCSDPTNTNREILCWKFSYTFDFLHKILVRSPENTRLDFLDRLRELDAAFKVDQSNKKLAIEHLLEFFSEIVSIETPDHERIPVMCKINEISSYLTPNSKENLDWLYFINKGFMNYSQVKSDEEDILIEDWKIFSKALELLENKSPRVVGDVLLLGFLYGYQHLYTMYSFGRIDSFKRGTKKDYQRYEQCLDLLGLYYGPGLLAMYISKYHENSTIVQAENFIREAINDVIIEFSKATDLDMSIKTDCINKLNHTFIVLGGLPQINDMKKMEELYSGIELKGDEKILETTIKLISYHNKIDNEPKTSWKYQVNGLSHLNNLKYIVEQNVLNVPFEYISYPYFHPNRSRFFNTATLFTEVVLTLNEGIKEHLKNNYGINYKLDYDSVELGYKNYLKWEKTHVEKTLPGFNLTNRQLYWLSFANSYFMKYHSNVSFYQLDALNVQFEYFHLWFKFRPEFREAFNCSEPTENEKKEFKVFVKKFYKRYRP